MKITLSDQQAGLVEEALDFYIRCRMGQFEEILSQHFPEKRNDTVVTGLLDRVHVEVLNLPTNTSPGIHTLPEPYKVAYDLKQVIRYHRSYKYNPSGDMGVNFDQPRNLSLEPMAEVDTNLTEGATQLIRMIRERVRWKKEKSFDAYSFVTPKGKKLVEELISKGFLKKSEGAFQLAQPSE